MSNRRSLALIVLLLSGAVETGAQSASDPPRTPWGTPDFGGVWLNATVTPLERPPELGNQEFYTDSELEALEASAMQRWRPNRERDHLAVEASPVWLEPGPLSRRTSLITGPTGTIPSLTPAAERRAAAEGGFVGTRFLTDRFDSYEDRPWSERCLRLETGGPPMIPFPIVGYLQIFQTPDHVVLLPEENHDVRIISLDGRPHVSRQIQLWRGDSRGYWDGDVLVIETRNFNGKGGFSGSGAGLLLTERLSWAEADTVLYEFTVTDPETWTEPWTAEMPLLATQQQLYEHACHEGNYSLSLVLSGARAEEQ